MTVLVTGASGFIGSRLCERLKEQGTAFYGIDLKTGQDINDFDYDSFGKNIVFKAVIHLAAKVSVHDSKKNPDPFWETDVEGSKKVFEWAQKKNCRIIAASSSNAKWWYLNPYATSKAVMEQVAPSDAALLRFYNVYSTDIRQDLLLGKIKRGEVKYKTDHYRDMIHVDEVCQVIERLLESNYKDISGIVDVGTGHTQSIKELIESCDVDVPLKKVTGEAQVTQADTTRLNEELNFYPKSNIMKDLPAMLKGEQVEY